MRPSFPTENPKKKTEKVQLTKELSHNNVFPMFKYA